MDLNKYIQTDFADGFGQVYSDRFGFADGFKQVYLDQIGRRIWTSIFRPIWQTDLDKYIQTDLADGFGQVYSVQFG